MRIAIVGGGWTGLVLAHHLTVSSHEITLYERSDQLGGLATYHDFGEFYWDRFYHVILPTDRALLEFLDKVGVGDRVRWKQTSTGYYVDDVFHSVSTTRDFLLFRPLNLWQKFRLAMTIILGARISNWRQLEQISVKEWLLKYSGRTTYEKFWKPLLMAKLGDSYTRVSAVFIWTYIKRLFRAREDTSARKEQMGYLKGGYKTVLDALEKKFDNEGVRVELNCTVDRIDLNEKGQLSIKANGSLNAYDKVIFTGPVSVLEKVVDPNLIAITGNTNKVEYLGVICMVLVLDRPITDFYVLNIADEDVPFTGVIGMTTLVDKDQTKGRDLVYLPKYLLSTDPEMTKSDEEIAPLFYRGLFKLYPDLKPENIISTHINRATKVQPLQVINYSKIIPEVGTLHKDFYVLNTAQFVNDTLNNDSVTRHVNRFMDIYGDVFEN